MLLTIKKRIISSNFLEFSIKMTNRKKFLMLLQNLLLKIVLRDIMVLFLHMAKQDQAKRTQWAVVKLGTRAVLYPEHLNFYSKRFRKDKSNSI